MKRVKGDSLTILCKAGEDITGWKIRAKIYNCNSSLDLATENDGGSDDQIYITDAARGYFSIFIPSGATTDFSENSHIEIEVETTDLVGGEPEIITVLQEEFNFLKEKIK